MADSNLNTMIDTALINIKKMTEVNTVIGDPIEISGKITVIPVSKVSVGFASGGMDYNSKAAPEKAPNFGGGTGSGFTITPVAFFTVDENGNVNLLSVGAAPPAGNDLIGTISGLVDKAPAMIEKIKQIFKKDSTENTEIKENKEIAESGAAEIKNDGDEKINGGT